MNEIWQVYQRCVSDWKFWLLLLIQLAALTGGAAIVRAEGTNNSAIIVPSDQKLFSDIVESHISKYKSTRNDLQRSALRSNRKEALQGSLPKLSVASWIGTVQQMSTDGDGNAEVKIRLQSSPILVNAQSSCGPTSTSSALIDHRSAVYDVFANSSIGDTVEFSGTFFSDDRDYILECSLTEAWSMTLPEFLFRITDVRLVTNAGSLGKATQDYANILNERVSSAWIRPANREVRCEITVRQSRSGFIVSYDVGPCNGDDEIVRSVVDALKRASPFPQPDNPAAWNEELRFTFVN